jgi:putative Mg2+ transporter-C (MgtC) family protein
MLSLVPFSAEAIDVLLRLAAAALVGMALGLNRDLKGKPTGMRTLALVCLGAALVAVAAVHYPGMAGSADAMSRVLQGIIQGVMTGVGFIGAGVIFRDRQQDDVRNLTTAATVWVTAALGIACALAAWEVVGIGAALTLLVLLLGAGLERRMVRLLGGGEATTDDVR